MAEKLIIRQSADFRTEFQAQDPEAPEDSPYRPVARLDALTPYGMLMAGLGACTAVLLNSYARSRGLGVREVEMRIGYRRSFREDCERCEEIGRYEERIEEDILLRGDLSSGERRKLFLVSRHCPVRKIIEGGIRIESRLLEEKEEPKG